MAQIRSLFLIDDDFIFNLIHTKTVEKAKFAEHVRAFENPLAALATLRKMADINVKDLPDLIFLDINMPEMDGWEFLEELKHFSCPELDACKVIVLSSSIDPSDIDRSKNYKMVYDFISKPLTPLKLSALSLRLENMESCNIQ